MEAKSAAMIVNEKVAQINEMAEETIFDEWALVKIEDSQWKVLMFHSPRAEELKNQFKYDVSSLKLLDSYETDIGEFSFSQEGFGTKFDAYLCAGENIFFLFNNTVKAASAITGDPSWEAAQTQFENLKELFIHHPIVV